MKIDGLRINNTYTNILDCPSPTTEAFQTYVNLLFPADQQERFLSSTQSHERASNRLYIKHPLELFPYL